MYRLRPFPRMRLKLGVANWLAWKNSRQRSWPMRDSGGEEGDLAEALMARTRW